jgi:hypothetical protein
MQFEVPNERVHDAPPSKEHCGNVQCTPLLQSPPHHPPSGGIAARYPHTAAMPLGWDTLLPSPTVTAPGAHYYPHRGDATATIVYAAAVQGVLPYGPPAGGGGHGRPFQTSCPGPPGKVAAGGCMSTRAVLTFSHWSARMPQPFPRAATTAHMFAVVASLRMGTPPSWWGGAQSYNFPWTVCLSFGRGARGGRS